MLFLSAIPFVYAEKLAQGKTVTADTEYSGSFIAEYAVDGDNSTRWCSAATGVPHWIYVDLNDTYQVTGVNILFELSYASNFTIEKSFNEIAWTTVLDNQTGLEGWVNVTFAENNGRYWRITGVTNPLSALSIFEFEIIGDTVPVPTSTPTIAPTEAQTLSYTWLYTGLLIFMAIANILLIGYRKSPIINFIFGIVSICIVAVAAGYGSYIVFYPLPNVLLGLVAVVTLFSAGLSLRGS